VNSLLDLSHPAEQVPQLVSVEFSDWSDPINVSD
jgi:hypothetical protein